jgi:hypothetical protein
MTTTPQQRRIDALRRYLAAGALCSLRDLPPCPNAPAPKPLACYATSNFYGWKPKGGKA